VSELEPQATTPDDSASDRFGRRVFLGMLGVGAGGLLVGDAALSLVGKATSPVTGALPEGVRAALPAPGGGWRIYTVNPPMPRFDPATWKLTIDGLVERPVTLTHDQLLELPRAEQVSDFYCVTGWSVMDVRWTGVRFADLLAAAGPLPTAKALRFVSAEKPYVDMLTMKQAMVDDAMLAYGMDGEPMTRPHGAPARLVMPKMYGYKGVKWVERIELVDRVEAGFWEQRGYDRDPWLDSDDAV
jgi:hypothetical protein